MTSILYSTFMHNLNIPEELEPGKKEYSFCKDLKVNGWGYLAVALSFGGDVMLARHKDWPAALRVIIALLPVVPALLWGRVFARWIRGMDELHRRMTVEVCLFATTATLFLFTFLRPLVSVGIFRPFEKIGLDFHTWWGTSWLLICFYLLGRKVLHRRFK